MASVEQAKLHELVRLDVLGHDHVECFEREPVAGKFVFDNPLAERFGHNRPTILDAVVLCEP